MGKKDNLKVKFFDDEEWGMFGDGPRRQGEDMEVMSWRTHWKLTAMRVMHPIGIHYMVPAYEFDKTSGRWINTGSTCWFC